MLWLLVPNETILETDMNIKAIKAAVDAGQTVHWANTGYIVHKDALGQYLTPIAMVAAPSG